MTESRSSSRRLVVTDAQGRILATSIHPEDTEQTDVDAPKFRGYIPFEGQTVHTISLTDEFSGSDGLRLLHQHKVEIRDGEPHLIPID